jgi:hypothetical protein
MSAIEHVSATPTDHRSTPAPIEDSDYSARWKAWLARGADHERLVRQQWIGVARSAILLAGAAALAYILTAP